MISISTINPVSDTVSRVMGSISERKQQGCGSIKVIQRQIAIDQKNRRIYTVHALFLTLTTKITLSQRQMSIFLCKISMLHNVMAPDSLHLCLPRLWRRSPQLAGDLPPLPSVQNTAAACRERYQLQISVQEVSLNPARPGRSRRRRHLLGRREAGQLSSAGRGRQ